MLAATAFAVASTTVQAYISVGPHGNYASIQAGVDAAIARSEQEVRVEMKYCSDIHGFQSVCAYTENVAITPTAPGTVLHLSGGWQADFQQQFGDGSRTLVNGTGSDNAIIKISINDVSSDIGVSRFDLDGTGISPADATHGLWLQAAAGGGSLITIADNTIRNNSAYFHGAGLTLTVGTATVNATGNRIESNTVVGIDSQGSSGGGAELFLVGDGQLNFTHNTLSGNVVGNIYGGVCHGGGVHATVASATGSAVMTMQGNTYSGNAQLFCTSGATGDAAELEAAGATLNIDAEQWTSNNVPSDPGVYEVFMHAESYGRIRAGNGLVTHGTWGGLYAQTDASSEIEIVNFTIADNPVLGYRGVGSGTHLWNTILWNDGSPYEFDGGATHSYCLADADPLFIDAANGDYRLAKDSPAINTADVALPTQAYYFDLDGVPRPYLGDGVGLPDVGAYEFHDDTIFRDGFGP